MSNDHLYFLDTIATYNGSLNVESCGVNRKIDNNNSGALWHKRLCHISKNRVERLLSDRILDSIDLTNFDVFVECVKGKLIKTKIFGAYRATNVLELIHTDICWPFLTPSWSGQQYFISLIDDYSRYVYIFLIHEKSQLLGVFKSFKSDIENQLNKRVKKVKYDSDNEYYNIYDVSSEQRPGGFCQIPGGMWNRPIVHHARIS